MIKLYPNSFYKNANLKNQFEEDYIKCLKNCSNKRLSKMDKIIKDCNLGLSQLHSLQNISGFPNSFQELLVLSPRIIAEIYIFYETNSKFKNRLDSIFRKNKLLDYDYYSKRILNFFIEKENDGFFSIKTCVYCNSAYINTFSINGKTSKRLYDLDHFIPKSKCPLFAFSLYNLIPCCQICNSRIKGDNFDAKDLTADKLEKLFPSSENYQFNETLKFRFFPKIGASGKINFPCTCYMANKNDFEIEFEKFRNSKVATLYEEKEVNKFFIKQRYETHNTEFLAHVDKHIKYSDAFFKLYFRNMNFDASELKEAIFNTSLRNDERQIFQKIYNDIDEIFE